MGEENKTQEKAAEDSESQTEDAEKTEGDDAVESSEQQS